MNLSPFPISITDFATISPEIHKGDTGIAEWRTLYRDDIRIRLVTYSAGYLADHWCSKGHIIFCVAGEMETELNDGSKHILKASQMYTVGDDAGSHRTYSKEGCTLFIVD
jgi:quercetin dioxygenase-like cupin family protein